MRIGSSSTNWSELSSKIKRIHMAEVLEVVLETSTDRSSRTKNRNASSTVSLEQART
jgi:hypothetical protein